MKRHRNDGLSKHCSCPRGSWPKCPHTWFLNMKPPGGKHYRLSLDHQTGRHIDSKSEAQMVAAQIRAGILAGVFRPAREKEAQPGMPASPQGPLTLESYARDWLATTAAQNLKASTVHFYRDGLDNHILPLLGVRPVAAINRADCRSLIATCRQKGLRVVTVRGIVRTLSSILSQAVEDGELPANPALRPGRYLRRGDEPEPQIDPLNRDDASALLAVAAKHFPEWWPFVLCGLRTGMRLGEMLGLQWGDVDWRNSSIQVCRNLVRGNLTTPKNHQSRRIDMSRQLRIGLRLHLRRERASEVVIGWLP